MVGEPERHEHHDEVSAARPAGRFCRMAAATSLDGRPAQEKIGSFCPLTSVLRPSMAVNPVSMNSSGRARAVGFMGEPVTGAHCSGMNMGRAVDGQKGAVEDPADHIRGQRAPS